MRKHASEGSTLSLKTRAGITKSPKQKHKWPHEKHVCPPNNLKNKQTKTITKRRFKIITFHLKPRTLRTKLDLIMIVSMTLLAVFQLLCAVDYDKKASEERMKNRGKAIESQKYKENELDVVPNHKEEQTQKMCQ